MRRCTAFTLWALAALGTASVLVGLGCDGGESSPVGLAARPTLKVGHVGHDHHLALYVAALEGERFRNDFGIYLKELKAREVYDLVDGERTLARLNFIKVGGGSQMP
ncbi:MAG: hypothetical protein AMS14_08050, partial [Planctomycetes bacterium DG_20]